LYFWNKVAVRGEHLAKPSTIVSDPSQLGGTGLRSMLVVMNDQDEASGTMGTGTYKVDFINVLNPQFLETPGEPIKRAYIPSKNSIRSICFETLRRAKKRDVKTLILGLKLFNS